ncbi:hypothetical protein PGTUg99_023064 [Puccinia graminis f. sp. tritici]|uniref:Uncharacterized protein n=1 Tax=Puccinia graminis f. sp. tritici TaxID=56615 RepID=A0A5B0S7C9_PUCGR|nr:hypothetical protein PGTUg99_023064 [Puccinia graminis f. sp. tritici]
MPKIRIQDNLMRFASDAYNSERVRPKQAPGSRAGSWTSLSRGLMLEANLSVHVHVSSRSPAVTVRVPAHAALLATASVDAQPGDQLGD